MAAQSGKTKYWYVKVDKSKKNMNKSVYKMLNEDGTAECSSHGCNHLSCVDLDKHCKRIDSNRHKNGNKCDMSCEPCVRALMRVGGWVFVQLHSDTLRKICTAVTGATSATTRSLSKQTMQSVLHSIWVLAHKDVDGKKFDFDIEDPQDLALLKRVAKENNYNTAKLEEVDAVWKKSKNEKKEKKNKNKNKNEKNKNSNTIPIIDSASACNDMNGMETDASRDFEDTASMCSGFSGTSGTTTTSVSNSSGATKHSRRRSYHMFASDDMESVLSDTSGTGSGGSAPPSDVSAHSAYPYDGNASPRKMQKLSRTQVKKIPYHSNISNNSNNNNNNCHYNNNSNNNSNNSNNDPYVFLHNKHNLHNSSNFGTCDSIPPTPLVPPLQSIEKQHFMNGMNGMGAVSNLSNGVQTRFNNKLEANPHCGTSFSSCSTNNNNNNNNNTNNNNRIMNLMRSRAPMTPMTAVAGLNGIPSDAGATQQLPNQSQMRQVHPMPSNKFRVSHVNENKNIIGLNGRQTLSSIQNGVQTNSNSKSEATLFNMNGFNSSVLNTFSNTNKPFTSTSNNKNTTNKNNNNSSSSNDNNGSISSNYGGRTNNIEDSMFSNLPAFNFINEMSDLPRAPMLSNTRGTAGTAGTACVADAVANGADVAQISSLAGVLNGVGGFGSVQTFGAPGVAPTAKMNTDARSNGIRSNATHDALSNDANNNNMSDGSISSESGPRRCLNGTNRMHAMGSNTTNSANSANNGMKGMNGFAAGKNLISSYNNSNGNLPALPLDPMPNPFENKHNNIATQTKALLSQMTGVEGNNGMQTIVAGGSRANGRSGDRSISNEFETNPNNVNINNNGNSFGSFEPTVIDQEQEHLANTKNNSSFSSFGSFGTFGTFGTGFGSNWITGGNEQKANEMDGNDSNQMSPSKAKNESMGGGGTWDSGPSSRARGYSNAYDNSAFDSFEPSVKSNANLNNGNNGNNGPKWSNSSSNNNISTSSNRSMSIDMNQSSGSNSLFNIDALAALAQLQIPLGAQNGSEAGNNVDLMQALLNIRSSNQSINMMQSLFSDASCESVSAEALALREEAQKHPLLAKRAHEVVTREICNHSKLLRQRPAQARIENIDSAQHRHKLHPKFPNTLSMRSALQAAYPDSETLEFVSNKVLKGAWNDVQHQVSARHLATGNSNNWSSSSSSSSSNNNVRGENSPSFELNLGQFEVHEQRIKESCSILVGASRCVLDGRDTAVKMVLRVVNLAAGVLPKETLNDTLERALQVPEKSDLRFFWNEWVAAPVFNEYDEKHAAEDPNYKRKFGLVYGFKFYKGCMLSAQAYYTFSLEEVIKRCCHCSETFNTLVRDESYPGLAHLRESGPAAVSAKYEEMAPHFARLMWMLSYEACGVAYAQDQAKLWARDTNKENCRVDPFEFRLVRIDTGAAMKTKITQTPMVYKDRNARPPESNNGPDSLDVSLATWYETGMLIAEICREGFPGEKTWKIDEFAAKIMKPSEAMRASNPQQRKSPQQVMSELEEVANDLFGNTCHIHNDVREGGETHRKICEWLRMTEKASENRAEGARGGGAASNGMTRVRMGFV